MFDRFEIGFIPQYKINDWFAVRSRFSLGRIFTSNKGDWNTYTIEPAVTVKLPLNFDASLGYMRRSGMAISDNDTSNNTIFGLGYSINQTNRISASYTELEGDNGGTANNANVTKTVTYTHSF